MSIPKIPASTAKLFTKKRRRRQVLVEPHLQEDGVDKTVQKSIIPETVAPTAPAAPLPPAVAKVNPRRRG